MEAKHKSLPYSRNMRQESALSTFKRTCLLPRTFQFKNIPWTWVLLSELAKIYNENCHALADSFTNKNLLWKWARLFRPIIEEGYWKTVDGGKLVELTSQSVGLASWATGCRDKTRNYVLYLKMDGEDRPFRIVGSSDLGFDSEGDDVYVPVGWAKDVLSQIKQG